VNVKVNRYLYLATRLFLLVRLTLILYQIRADKLLRQLLRKQVGRSSISDLSSVALLFLLILLARDTVYCLQEMVVRRAEELC
jgi:hypothetical protein